MPFPKAPSMPNVSAGSASSFIPQIWSQKLNAKFYMHTMYREICNTNWEGEIKDHGDEVIIRNLADITINDYVKGQDLDYEDPESTHVTLKIDQGHYFGFKLTDVDKTQSDLKLMNQWADDGAEKMKIRVDANVLGSVYANAGSMNAGAAAGADSQSINLGTSGTPMELTKLNIVDFLVENIGVCLDETDTPDTDRYIVLPPSLCARIKTSELKDASLTGDGNSTLRTGKIGMIDRLHIYSSRNLNKTAGGVYDIMFGHKSAITFAHQITHMETLRNQKDFGDLARSLFVYGFEVVKPEQLGHGVVSLG
ncbi:hypothetical protein [Gayadomonas joobiniege]|uniref:hypothetical protein n=1 Tax=Gayadomonas joobiniege TaxID=1234606 RepID=UPI00037290C5|nr:hypothetical protein [Gayadomonas joobiniege]